jgi:putative membrane protein
MRKLLALVALLPAFALAVETKNPDHDFYTKAAAGGMEEVEMAKLAEQHAKSAQVKSFAEMMVKDHTAANEKLKSLAATKGVPLPEGLSTTQKASVATLKMHSSTDFDDAYIKAQIDAHEDTVALLQKEIANGEDPDARAFASKMLPTVQQHLEKIKEISASNKVSANRVGQ